MTKRERIMAAVKGEKPDRLPYSFWTHLPMIDLDPVENAQTTYEFYKTYDIDFIKTMNNGMYSIEDFGCEIDYSEIPLGGVAKVTKTPVNEPEDWDKIVPVAPDKGALARELKYLDLLKEKLKADGDDVPVIFTVFSPLTTANKLSGNKLMEHLKAGYAEKIHRAIDAIAETTAAFTKLVIEHGADGVFFAVQSGRYSFMTAEQYREFGVPYDYKVLEAAKGGWMNTIHAHGEDIMFEVLKDYPVQVFNWHAWETLPMLDEAYTLTGKCLCAGLSRMDITNCNRNEVLHQIYQSFKLMGGMHQILTPGCVIRYPLDESMLHFVKEAKDTVEACFLAK